MASLEGSEGCLPRLEDDFELTNKVLGSGATGKVVEGICRRTGKAFAVKSFKVGRLSQKQWANLAREVDVHSAVEHPRLVWLQAVYEAEEHVHLVTEQLRGGELFDRMMGAGRLDEPSAARVAAQVLRAMAYLHARGMVHRDLKPENIMFDEKDGQAIKLIDFGFASRVQPREQLTQMLGTIQYVAPEVLQRTGYDAKADIWSVGSVLYTLMTTKVLYGGDDDQVARKNKAGAVDFSRAFKTLSEEGQRFVRGLLCVDPEGRPTALEALQDPWLRRLAPDEVEAALAEARQDALLGAEALRQAAQPRHALILHVPTARTGLASLAVGAAGGAYAFAAGSAAATACSEQACGQHADGRKTKSGYAGAALLPWLQGSQGQHGKTDDSRRLTDVALSMMPSFGFIWHDLALCVNRSSKQD